MKIGVTIVHHHFDDYVKVATSLGIHTCQLLMWADSDLLTPEYAEHIKQVAKENDMEITALWRGWRGPTAWNFTEGPHTLGIVPPEYRADRIYDLKRGADFAVMLGVKDVATHMGFIPEVPTSAEYEGVRDAVREVAEYYREKGVNLLFETGQETPVTLLRIINDVNTGNLYINLDPANLILYGKANPVDALEVFGKYVRGVHGKDGLYPTDGMHLGKEVRVGDGLVHFERLIPKLKECGYDGAITIEREISGEQQIADIRYAKEYLERLF